MCPRSANLVGPKRAGCNDSLVLWPQHAQRRRPRWRQQKRPWQDAGPQPSADGIWPRMSRSQTNAPSIRPQTIDLQSAQSRARPLSSSARTPRIQPPDVDVVSEMLAEVSLPDWLMGVDLRSTAGNCAWARTPQLTPMHLSRVCTWAEPASRPRGPVTRSFPRANVFESAGRTRVLSMAIIAASAFQRSKRTASG